MRSGPEVTTVKAGDRVGVGAQVSACLECQACKSGNENYCPSQVGKYDPLSSILHSALFYLKTHTTATTLMAPWRMAAMPVTFERTNISSLAFPTTWNPALWRPCFALVSQLTTHSSEPNLGPTRRLVSSECMHKPPSHCPLDSQVQETYRSSAYQFIIFTQRRTRPFRYSLRKDDGDQRLRHLSLPAKACRCRKARSAGLHLRQGEKLA